MGIKTIALDLDHADRDIGTVIGNTLQIHRNVREDKALLDRTFSLLESLDVICLHHGIDIVDDFL